MIRYYNKQRGFTLVELLVYISLLLIMSIASVSLMLSLQSTLSEQRSKRALTQGGVIAMERMLYEIRESETITVPLSTLGSSPGVLVLEQETQDVTFDTNSGSLRVAIDGSTAEPLTDTTITVDNLVFTYFDNTRTEMVRVDLTLTATIGSATSTQTFTSSAVLRNSYD